MRHYSEKISLTKNSRGVYSIDPSMGCANGIALNKNGCYSDCYAYKSAKLYGYDFGKTVFRKFENKKHEEKIISAINRIKLDFVRMGTMGDPSEDWQHTVNICRVVSRANKEIVIITKHWTNISDSDLEYLGTINVCINTSVSALDPPNVLANALFQYHRIKQYCRSILRIVSANFNTSNPDGFRLHNVQLALFKNEDVLDTVLRVNPNNKYVSDGIINVKRVSFLGKQTHASKANKKTYFGKCSTCPEMCGVKMDNPRYSYPFKRFIPKQLGLFK